MMADAIPEAVLEILETVRSKGETNMLGRSAVICLAFEYGVGGAQLDAALWLEENPDRYIEALKAMGARR